MPEPRLRPSELLVPAERWLGGAAALAGLGAAGLGLLGSGAVGWSLVMVGPLLAGMVLRAPRRGRPWAVGLVVLLVAGALERAGGAPAEAGLLAGAALGLGLLLARVCRQLNQGPLSDGPHPQPAGPSSPSRS
jgi:hypothetical protein